MTHTNEPHHDPREAQRANILEGARRVFARKGKAATMADVAAAAGVSQGLAYRYFTSKEEIYLELARQAMEQASLVTAPLSADLTGTPAERLTTLLTHVINYRRDHLEVFQLLDQMLSSDKAPDTFTDMIRMRGEQFVGELRNLIVEGQAAGDVATGDPDQLVVAIVASLDGLVRFGLHHPEQFPKVCPDASIFLRMLKP